ncbi:MAG: thioredoxin domain-containing protein [Ferruginibacter sp.]
MQHKHVNHLIAESSPYLLQHAHNPVNWYPWGEEALNKAGAENKIILVSIGYSACHWCHVMERESFEDEQVAAIMNENFINIKIDREERPDIDHIYMDAVQAMTGSGGWPLNVFLTPAARPFYGGTYFPPQNAFNRPSWTEILVSVVKAWNERPHEIEAQAENVTGYLEQSNSLAQAKFGLQEHLPENIFTPALCETIFKNIMGTADREWGGFGKAPKFPQTFSIQYLLQYHYYTGNKDALQQALLSIDKMLEGGIYDHVAGGMARYSTDREWLAPHFEKMLYDNALLINILCDAYLLSGDKKYARSIDKTISFVVNELYNSEGGFNAALDADSEGEEGKYYTWQRHEIENILGADAGLFCAFFDVSENGNWEEKNILRILKPAESFAKEKNIDINGFEEIIQASLKKLEQERNKRIRPGLDDKVILSWNALMLQAIAKAATALDNDHYRQTAIKNFNFLKQNLKADQEGELMHTWKKGVAKYPAFLDDYANLALAALQLYEATFDKTYLYDAKGWCEYVISHFSDEEQIFFYYTNTTQTDVIIRKKEIYDGATPSGNAVMASVLFKLSVVFDNAGWKNRAINMLSVISPMAAKYPGSFGIWASLLLQQVSGLNEIVFAGAGAEKMAAGLLAKYIPSRVILTAMQPGSEFPLISGKFIAGKNVAYLCKNYTCQAPVSSPEELYEQIVKKDKI